MPQDVATRQTDRREENVTGYGEKLRALRGERPAEEVANAVGISRSAIGMYENEERIPRDDIKIRLANYYQTTVQDIFFECNATV